MLPHSSSRDRSSTGTNPFCGFGRTSQRTLGERVYSSRVRKAPMRRVRPLGLVAALAVVFAVGSGGAPARVAAASADLAVTNTPSPSPVHVGATLTYTIGVRNN